MLTRIPATILAIAALVVCLMSSTQAGAQTLTVWPSPIAVTPDDDGNWTTSLVVANTGVTSAVGVEVRVTLAEADLVSALPQAVLEETEAVWALGTLAPGEFRSVEVTTTGALAPATVTAIAGDTRTFTAARGTEAAPADEELAAALLPTAGIASDDPFVLAEVALLAGDVAAIDARIAELTYHPYLGALRGARGTLWENAGNALDRAILETTMLRAAGVPARLGQATLSDAVAAALLDAIDVESNRLAAPRYTPETLLEMIESVPEAAELLVDAGFPAARAEWPEYVAGLFTRASDNPRFMDAARMYWFSERNEGGWVATHPLTGTAIAADSVHVEVPEEEFHTISLSLQVEVFNPGFMLSFGADEYLAAELRSADLAGRPVTLAYESVFSGGAGLVFSSTSREYTPQLWIDGQVAVEGDSFLELATSFPFGSQFVMGATLEMDIRSPGAAVDSLVIPIADRFGAAARSGLVGDSALDINVSEAVAGLAAFDNITIGVGTGAPAHYAELRATSELAASRAALEQVFPALEEMRFRTEDGLVQSADDRALVTQSEQISRDASRAMTSYLANRYLRWASISVEQIAAENIVVAFDSTPRVAVAGVVSTAAGAAPFMDVARNEVTILRPEGVPEFVEQRFKLTRGASDSILEGWVLSTWSTDETTVLIDVTTVFAAAEEQGVPLLELGPNDVFRVASLRLPPDAQAAITQTLLDGFGVVTPTAEVDVRGIPSVMWYRIDPNTGDMISMDATGRHVAAMQYGTLTNSILGEGFGFAVGALHGWSSGTLKGIAGFLGGTLGKFSAGGAATSAGACALGAGGGTAGGIAGAVIGGGGDPAATAQNLIMTLLGEAASRNKLGVAPFISGFNNGFCLGEMMATAYVQSMTAGAGGADPPIGELGVGQQGPWRRPLWSESMPLTVIEDGFATPDSDHGVWAAGSLVFTNTGVALQGEIRVRGEANVVRDGELLDSGDVDLEVFAVRASTLHGTGVGEVAQRESSIDVRALSGDATGLVEVYAVWEEEAAPTWLRLEAAEVSIDAPRAWGRVTFGDEASADAEIEVTGTFFSNFGLRARMVIDLFAGSTEFPDIEGGVLLEGLPTEVTVSPGEPFSLTPLARGAIEVSRAVAEAPVGWLVDATETSLVVTPTTAVPGDYDVWVLLLDEDLQPIAGSNVRVTIEASEAEVRVSGEYVPLYTAPWGNTQLATIAAFEVSLLGRDAADITLEATANAGFDVVSGADALSLETGAPALVYVRALPETTLPAPGSTVELTITATGPGFVGSDTVSFAMPSVVDADMRLSPDYARGIIGDSGEAVLTLTGTGNATKDITLTLTPPAGVSWDGVPESVSLSPGEELDIPLTWTIEDNALVGFSSGQMLALYDGEVWLNYYPLRVYVASPASAKAFSSADFSQDLDEDLLLRFLELGEAIERVEADCYDNSVLELEVRLNNLATQLGTLVPALLTDELRAQAASLADSGYSCEAVDLDWICATLTQIEDVLRELDDALGPRVFVTSLGAPVSVANGDVVNVVATMQNQGDDVSEAFDVTFSARQRGAAAAFATVTIPALAPGETFDAMAGWDSSAVLGSVVLSVATPRDDRFVVVSVEPALAPDGNAPPTFTSVPPVEMLLGEDLEYEVVAEDPDGDAIFYSALLTAPGFRLRDGLVIGRATRPTSLEFSLAATDRYGATTLQDFTIEVATIIDNASPRVTSVPARNTPVDQAWQYTARAIDVDGDALTWSYNDGPAGAAYDAETRTLTWTPTELGVEWFSLSVADERGATTLHRFSVTVTASATRPDFALGDVDLGDVMIDGLIRNGDVTISVTNASGIAAPATELVVFSGSATGTELGRVTVDVLAGFASASIDVAIAGEADFARQPLLAVVDLDDEVDEENEANNESRTVVLPNTSDFLYAFMRPVEARVFLVAANNATPFRAIDPASGAILQEGIVEAREALEVTAALVDQDTIVPLNHAMVEADGALQVYLTFEVFNDDFGGDIVHPAIDGSLTGLEYTVFVPTVTSNNRLVVTALDDATVTMRDATLTELESIGLRAGQVWEPQGLTSRQVVTLSSTGRLFVQSASVTGLSSIPPLSSTSTDDVGQRFTFSTRSRGSGGGAFAVIGYEDASFTLRANGQVFAQGEVAQGEVAFFAGIGELRGAVLEATGDVAVLAGDVASPGADRVGLMGEDIVQTLGRGGRSFIVPTLEQLAIEPVVLVGEQTTWLTIDGETQAVAPWSRVTLPQAEVATIEASAPVVVQTMGGGERFFDYASLVRRLAVPFTPADPVLAAASISLETCASSVTATARIGNAGGAPLSADLEVELVALDDAGARIVATERLGVAVASGEFVEVALSAAGASLESQTSWAIRIAGAQPRAQRLTTDAAVCINEAPSFVTFPPGAVESNTQLTYTALAIDPEGATVRYDLLGGPLGATLNPLSGSLRWDAGEPAVVSFAIAASDDAGEVAVQSFDVLVGSLEECTPENDGDNDGVCPPQDCDDTNENVSPLLTEIVGDGLDNDCNPATPDVVPTGGVGVTVAADSAAYAPGLPVAVTVDVTNRSNTLPINGLSVELEVACVDGSGTTLTNELGQLIASATETSGFEWTETAGVYGVCTLAARVLAGAQLAGSAATTVTFDTSLTGELTIESPEVLLGDSLTVNWSVETSSDSQVSERVTIRRTDVLDPIVSNDVVVTPGMPSAAEEVLDTTGWPTATHRLSLSAANMLLADAEVAVRTENAARAFAAPNAAVDGLEFADGEVIRFRPRGPRASGAGFGGVVQAAWAEDALALRITLNDETADDADRIAFSLTLPDNTSVAAEWTRGAGGEGFSEENGVRGLEVTWTADVETALAFGDELALAITLEDGPADARNDVWTWGVSPFAGVDGVLTLLEPGAQPEPDVMEDTSTPDAVTDAGADSGQDTGGADSTSDSFENDGTDGTGAETETVEVKGGCGCESAPGAGDGVAWLAVLLGLLGLRFRGRLRVRGVALGLGVLSLGLLTACGGGKDRQVIDIEIDGTGPDAGTGGGNVEVGLPDTGTQDGGLDTGDPDVTPDVVIDVIGPDVTPDAGAWPDLPEPGEGGETGEACEGDNDCASGICQSAGDFALCTELCSAGTCPEGFACQPYPGGVELCVANDVCLDDDGDGYGNGRSCLGLDCDDTNALAWTGATELCDGVDNNCDGNVDEGVLNACGACGDVPVETCNGFDDDCDGDVDEGVLNACGFCGPLPIEVCNGEDDNCDGSIDEGVCLECEIGEERACYGGPEGTQGVGQCRGGIQRCESNGWSPCLEQTLPSEEVCDDLDNNCDGEENEGLINACGVCGELPIEICNEIDDDCDGEVDEGVQSRCGGCTPCGEAVFFPSEVGDADPTVAPAPDGAMTLATGLLERHDIWVPNSQENTVSRWDTRTGRELGRYWVGESPSRTAVDLNGNVWVGNRGDGTATHIFGDTRDCVDRNGDGVIQTSRDLNGDGVITGAELLPEAFENALADECVNCQIRVGTATDLVRGVGVDADNYGWLGTYNSQELFRVDPLTCEIVAQFSTAGPNSGERSRPIYGLAITPDGELFTSSFGSACNARVSIEEERVIEHVCSPGTTYGMAVGPDGRVWYGGAGAQIYVYDPAERTWTELTPPEGGLRYAAGMVVDNDGVVYIADHSSSAIVKYDPATSVWEFFYANTPPSGLTVQTGIRGVTIDAEGHIWGFALSSSGLVEMNTDGDWIGSYDVVSASNPSNGVGVYSYSDNTGFQLFNIVAREGRWSNLIDVGAAVRFLELEIISFEPESTSVETEVRWGNSVEEVNDAEWVVAGTSGIVSLRELVPDATRYLEVRVTMRTSDPLQRPVVRDVQVRYETVDCRLAGGRCPASQICDPVYGGCLVPPPSCFQDNQCGFDQYCDATGSCRFGCRQNGGSCALGEVCDTEERVCVSNSVDCNDNANCEDGSYCDASGVCIAGCRLTENDCPRGFTCDADARTCEPVAPECATDAECGDGDYCQGSECVPGCRLAGGNCGEEEVCDAISRACVPAPPACDPEAISEEICNGLDDDCDGEIDNAPIDVGVTCMAGDRLTGETVCLNAALLCRADPATTEAGETIAQYASVAIDDSQTSGRAVNITGPPEATRCASLADSWQGPTDDTEGFFHVGFDVAVRPTELRVYNNRYPGGVTRIDVVTTDGDRLEDVWSGVDDAECAAALTIDLSAIDEPIDEVIVYSMIENREEYDAVELVGASVSPTPPRLAGALDNVLLPAAEYRVIGELLSVVDRSFMELGVSFTSPLGEWELARSGEGDSQWTGVAFHNTSVNWRGTGAHLIEDSVFTADVATDFDTRAMPLRVLGSDFRNVQLDSLTSANALIADSRFVADVSVPALLTLTGGGEVRDSEIIGENRLPRRGTGLVLGGTTPITASGVSISKLDIGIRLTSGSGTGHLISDSVVQDSDEGVYISSGRAEFRNVLFDYTDPGHQGLAITEVFLSPAQGIDLYDVTFDLGIGDLGLVTDVSRFNEASPTVWENLTFLGGSPERFVGLAGSTDTGNVTIEPTAGVDTFFLYGNTTIASDAILNIEDVSIVTSAANGYQYMRASARSATTVRNTSFRNTALYSTAAGPTLDIADSNFVYTYDSVSRSMIEWSGVLTGARLAFTSIADAGLSTRLHTGVYIINEGEATLTDLTLTGLRYGLSSGDNTVLTATDVVARDCTYGLRPFEQTVMTINDFTFIDESELLDSIGMDSDLQVGGQFSIVNASFSGDAADRAIEMDYDSFATGSESTVTGDVSFEGEIVPVVLNGDWTDTDMPLVIRPVVEDTPILLPGNVSWTRDDGIVLDGSVRLAAFPDTAGSITVGAASSLTMMPGTSLENLRVANSGTMTAEGVEFFADRITSELVDNLGTFSCTDCLFGSVERTANGLRTESGGEATLVNTRFENLLHATITNQNSSITTATGSTFDDVTTAIWTGGLVDVSFEDTTIIGGEEQTTGLLNTSPLDGLALELVDTSFELSENDRPFYLDIEVLRDTNSLSVTGSSFVGGEVGLGYQLTDVVRGGTVNLAMLEPAQPAWVLTTRLYVYSDSVLNVADDTVMVGDTTFRAIDYRNDSSGMIGAAEFEDVLVYFYNAGTNSVDGTRFSTERTGQFTALYVEGSANVSITDVTVVDGAVETSASNGVWVRGADSTVSVTNSTFDSLTYGLRLQSGGTMTQSGNTFIECGTDLLGF